MKHQPPAGEVVSVPLSRIRRHPRAWPRRGTYPERVGEFLSLYIDEGLEALPPVEVMPDVEGKFLLVDGHHRVEALLQTDAEEVPAIITVPSGPDPFLCAFERGLASAATSARPLTRQEKRAAVDRLLSDRPSASDREIARLAGVSHTFVAKRRGGSATLPPDDDPGNQYVAGVTGGEIAERLVRGMARLWESRGISDVLFGDRGGKYLARALLETHGGDALTWARRLYSWTEAAVSELEEEGR